MGDIDITYALYQDDKGDYWVRIDDCIAPMVKSQNYSYIYAVRTLQHLFERNKKSVDWPAEEEDFRSWAARQSGDLEPVAVAGSAKEDPPRQKLFKGINSLRKSGDIAEMLDLAAEVTGCDRSWLLGFLEGHEQAEMMRWWSASLKLEEYRDE